MGECSPDPWWHSPPVHRKEGSKAATTKALGTGNGAEWSMDWFSYGNPKETTTLSLNIEVSRIFSHHLIGNEACFGFDQQYCRSHQNETSKWD